MECACLKDATAVVKQKLAHGAKPTKEFTDLTTDHFILQNTGVRKRNPFFRRDRRY
jgi:hypothetical protein